MTPLMGQSLRRPPRRRTAFGTGVPQPAFFRDHESEFAPPEAGSVAGKTFAVLAEELSKALPSTCRRRGPDRGWGVTAGELSTVLVRSADPMRRGPR